jgi:hypothetical protein
LPKLTLDGVFACAVFKNIGLVEIDLAPQTHRVIPHVMDIEHRLPEDLTLHPRRPALHVRLSQTGIEFIDGLVRRERNRERWRGGRLLRW